ncbi:HlyD family efflux transporter periplasmic adaptor subunit [Aphanothece sacrum]|uniref:Secretion protein HlyD family protein n=1 Tax=Aphanothece sacrum FPU1 TaxID=1920663 RepID=A0A401II21_APHSA|nr:HlyD family efflux transporter periplasmic adaptor subunit [Aphanothece sacrum]GBF80879.1 secretion protein HlyD family protein [Aphanothece sacrum FPU1]GBF85186.1 secretion protein HlyD family protein [Aphanothece sacrum FPU3]
MTNGVNNGRITKQSQNELSQDDQLISQVTETQTNHQDDWANSTKDILDTLPRVWTRGLLYFLVVFVIIVLPWALLAKVDETGTANGKLEPKGKTIKLDAPVEGKVSLINVKEGDIVKSGQSLIEIESELIQADFKQQQTKLEGQEQKLNQLNFLEKQLQLVFRTQQQQNQAQKLEKLAQVNQAKQNLDALKNAYDLQKEEKLAQVNQAKQELAHNQEAIKLAEIQFKNAQGVKNRYDTAVEEGIVSQIQVIEREDTVQERKKAYEQSKSDIQQAKHRLAEQKSSYERTLKKARTDIKDAELRLKEQENSSDSLMGSAELSLLKNKEEINNLQTEISTLKSDIKQTKSQIESLQFQLSQRVVKAPIAGTIFHLPIEGEGTVVQSGTRLLEIAPQGTALILRAQMATTESGSITKGMLVKMKFDAFPFQDYGIIEGKLIEVSPTTSEIDTPNGKVLAYDLKIELNKTCMPTPKKCIKLRPGDTATAEVIVRQRRLIDFVLDPFKKLQNGGFKL